MGKRRYLSMNWSGVAQYRNHAPGGSPSLRKRDDSLFGGRSQRLFGVLQPELRLFSIPTTMKNVHHVFFVYVSSSPAGGESTQENMVLLVLLRFGWEFRHTSLRALH